MSQSPGDLRPNLLAASIVSTAIALAALMLRIIARVRSQTTNLWWDDWLALASTPFVLALAGLNGWAVSIGQGLHISEAEKLGNPSEWNLILYIDSLVYNAGLSLVKLSVVFFYLRVFKNVRIYKYAIWFGVFLAIAWFLVNSFVSAFGCTPVRATWHPEIPHTCVALHKGLLATAISDVIIDLYILLLPMPILWHLQISTRRKISLTGIFLCGYCVPIVSVLRIVSIVKLGTDFQDYTWTYVYPSIVALQETPIALFASCLPAIFALIEKRVKRHKSRTARLSQPLSQTNTNCGRAVGNQVNLEGPKHELRVLKEVRVEVNQSE